jgi:hypothetical protein
MAIYAAEPRIRAPRRPALSPAHVRELCRCWGSRGEATDAARLADDCGWPVARHDPPVEMVAGSGVWAVAVVQDPTPGVWAGYVTYREQ